MADIRMICAVGESGQIGLNGMLPWGHDIGDLSWFREQTMGHVVLMGHRTRNAIGALHGRTVLGWDGISAPESVIKSVAGHYPGRVLFIAGGAYTYATFAPFCTKFIITRVEYDGDADAWFDPAWICTRRDAVHD